MDTQHIIVGAGAHGLALAYQLARDGSSVTVLEADEIASGASGGPGKRGVRANRRDIRELELASLSQELWPGLADELGGDTGYERIGGIYLRGDEASGNASSPRASAVRAAVQENAGVPTELWDREATREQLPTVASDVLGASYCRSDGVASHEATTRLYASAAVRHGARILEHTPVHAIERNLDGRATGVVLQDGSTLSASKSVTVAANTGTNGILERSSLDTLPIWPIYPQALFLSSPRPSRIPYLVAHDSKPLSIKVLDDDVIMLSGGWRGTLCEKTGRGIVVEANVEGNIAQLTATFPELDEVAVLEADASRSESASIDGVPTIDTALGSPNLFVATGWTGHGWAIVPGVSILLRRWITTGEKPAELAPFSWDRFSRKVTPHV